MPPDERVRRGRREPTYLPQEEWAKAGAWLEEAWRDRNRSTGLSKRSVLAAIEYEGGTNRLNGYFSGATPPKPKTLRGLCKILGLSYVEAVSKYGYYREFIVCLDDLVWLGEQWLEEDNARGGTLGPDRKPASCLGSLRDTGVLYWKGVPTRTDGNTAWHLRPDDTGRAPFKVEPIEQAEAAPFLSRYVVGSWEVAEHRALSVQYAPIEFKAGATVSLVLDPSKAVRQEAVVVPQQRHVVVVPKPVALAIFLAVLVFPRRGDKANDNAREYQDQLYRAAGRMIEEAAERRAKTPAAAGRPKGQNPLLKRTREALDDSTRYFDARRVIAAEHAVAWADQLCRDFTYYARLSAFYEWGEAGSRASTVTPFTYMPQRCEAKFLAIEALTSYT